MMETLEPSDSRARDGQRLLCVGALLFLFALLVGLAVPGFAVPRLGLSTHLLGLMQGTFLLVAGLLWPKLKLTRAVWLFVLALTMVTHAQAQSGPTATPGVGTPAEIIGRWVLIATIRNGEDVTQAGVTQGGDPFIYDFKANGTFSITRGARIAETGTWAANEKAVPISTVSIEHSAAEV